MYIQRNSSKQCKSLSSNKCVSAVFIKHFQPWFSFAAYLGTLLLLISGILSNHWQRMWNCECTRQMGTLHGATWGSKHHREAVLLMKGNLKDVWTCNKDDRASRVMPPLALSANSCLAQPIRYERNNLLLLHEIAQKKVAGCRLCDVKVIDHIHMATIFPFTAGSGWEAQTSYCCIPGLTNHYFAASRLMTIEKIRSC